MERAITDGARIGSRAFPGALRARMASAPRGAGGQGASLFRRCLPLLLLLAPATSYGLGLGRIEVTSSLNEPFSARIEIVASENEREGLAVRLADEEAFRRAGIARIFPVTALRFELEYPEEGGEGLAYILVATEQPLREPGLNFIVEAESGDGRLLREYTVLLDPPYYEQAQAPRAAERRPAPPPIRPPVVSRPSAPPPAPAAVAVRPAARPSGALPVQARPGEDYLVRRGDTLWAIAIAMRPDRSISIQQMMLALLRTNLRGFFLGGNINALRAGAVLRMPSQEELSFLDGRQAIAQVAQHNRLWQGYKQGRGLASPVPPVPAAPPVKPAPAQPPTQAPGDAAPAPEAAPPAAPPPAESMAGEAPGAVQPAPPAEPPPQPELRVVSAGPDGAAGEGGDDAAATQQQLSLAQEELASKVQELEEVGRRLEQTEEIVSDLRRMINLRDNELSAMQQRMIAAEKRAQEAEQARAESALPVAVVPPAAEPPPVEPPPVEPPPVEPPPVEPPPVEPPPVEPPPVEPPPVEPPPAEPPPAEPPPVEPPPAEPPPAEPPPAEPPPVEDSSPEGAGLLDNLMGRASAMAGPVKAMAAQYAIPAGGGLAVLVIAGVGLLLYRRRKAASDEEFLDEEWMEDGNVTQVASDVTQVAPGGEDEVGGEPDTEADFDDIEAPGAPAAESADEEEGLESTEIEELPLDEAANIDFEVSDDDEAEIGARLAEVNVLLAYSEYDKAAEFIHSALAEDPENLNYHLKLLEIYGAQNDPAAFEKAAGTLREKTGGEGEQWEAAVNMWQEMGVGRALFEASSEGEVPDVEATSANIAATQRLPREEAAKALAEVAAGGAAAAADDTQTEETGELLEALDFDLEQSAGEEGDMGDATELFVGGEAPSPGDSLDRTSAIESEDELDRTTSLEPGEIQIPGEESPPQQETAAGAADEEELSLDDVGELDLAAPGGGEGGEELSLDEAGDGLDLASAGGNEAAMPPGKALDEIARNGVQSGDSAAGGEAAPEAEAAADADAGAGDESIELALELEEGPDAGAEPGAEEAEATTSVSDTPASKLDLARAYIELGDMDNAKSALTEVMAEGDEAQRKEAQQLLSQAPQ